MEKALMGLEHEYGLYYDSKAINQVLDVYDYQYEAKYYFLKFILAQLRSILPPYSYLFTSDKSAWLQTGMRIYADGFQLEVATPECASFQDLIFQKNLGHTIVQQLINATRRALAERPDGYSGPLAVYANNTANNQEQQLGHESEQVTFGCHENYLLRRDKIRHYMGEGDVFLFPYLAQHAAIFFALRPVLGGSGHITPKGMFVLSPRSYWMKNLMHSESRQNRSFINTRDEPHAADAFLRFHYIAGDTNITDALCRMKMAFTYWVLRLVEIGWRAPEWLQVTQKPLGGSSFSWYQFLEFAKEVNRDITLERVYAMGKHKNTAIALLQFYLDAVDAHRNELAFEAEDEEIFREVTDYLAVARGGYQELFGQSEWATKYVLTEKEMRKKAIPMNHPIAHRLSTVLHNIDTNPETNPLIRVRNAILPRNLEVGDLSKAIRKAPRTRATLRGLAVFLAKRFNIPIEFVETREWAVISIPKLEGGQIKFELNSWEPWALRARDIARLVRAMKPNIDLARKNWSRVS